MPDDDTSFGSTDLRLGYRLGDLQRLARYAAHDCWWISFPHAERVEVAFSALAEHLYAAEEPPSWDEMRNVARAALKAQVRADLRHHGFDRETGTLRPGFVRQWLSSPTTASPEDFIIDRLALAQIWAVIPEPLREAIQALADCEDYGLAADKLGLTRPVLSTRVSRGRQEFLTWWHQGEEPSRLYSRHRPNRRDPKWRAPTRSIIDRERYKKTKRTSTGPLYGRRRRLELPVSDAELARRYDEERATLAELAAEFNTTPYTIRRRILAARPTKQPADRHTNPQANRHAPRHPNRTNPR